MRIAVRYGRGERSARVSDDVRVDIIAKPAMPALCSPTHAVAAALDGSAGEPSGGRNLSLEALARGAASACILVCDITRPVPNGLFLRPLIERLLGAGVPCERISVLVATGLHRPNVGDELEEVLGDPWVGQTVSVHNHDARSDEEHVLIGTTSRGTRVELDRRFVEAQVRIATGLVEPHFMAGYSGGRKVIVPGVAHRRTITTFHNYRFMSDPSARNCHLEDNPLHRDQLEIVEMIGGALAVNTVIDETRHLAFVNFGEIVATHLDAVAFTRRYAEVPVGRRYRTVVTSAAGYPLDKTYYQTVKGMVAPLDILEPGGDLIVVSECSEGLGSSDYRAAQRRFVEKGRTGFLTELVAKDRAAVDEWQTQMQTKPMERGRVTLVTDGLDSRSRRLTGVECTADLGSAIGASLARHREDTLAVIPEGPYLIPVYRPAYQESVR